MIIRRTLLRIPKTKNKQRNEMRVRLRQIILTRILWIERTEVVFMEKPLVSVVMPVYNGERYIGKAIESALDRRFR